jgi:cell filamentation protein
MENNKDYFISDHKHADPKTKIIHNHLGITDNNVLQEVEYYITTQKIEKLKQTLIPINDFKDILKLHKNIFDTIYPWAGELREVPTFKIDPKTKKETEFLPPPRFEEGIEFINNLLSKFKQVDKRSKPDISKNLAQILVSLNKFHPFREGNGRTQRMVIYFLAKEKGYILDLNPPNNLETHQKYKEGTINGDKELLTELIQNCMKPDSQQTSLINLPESRTFAEDMAKLLSKHSSEDIKPPPNHSKKIL